jgi:hypothetical protein
MTDIIDPSNSTNSTSPFTEQERVAVIVMQLLGAFLTTFSSFIFLVYVVVQTVRKKINPKKNMSLRLLVYLQFCNMFSAISATYILHTSVDRDVDFGCILQAVQNQFFDWGSFLWTLCIAVFLLITVVFNVQAKDKLAIKIEIMVSTYPIQTH